MFMLPAGRVFSWPLNNIFINNALFTFHHDNRQTNRRMSRPMQKPPGRRMA